MAASALRDKVGNGEHCQNVGNESTSLVKGRITGKFLMDAIASPNFDVDAGYDLNESVDLNVLCKKCDSICKDIVSIRETEIYEGNMIRQHYASVAQLDDSAESGCHMCTLLCHGLERQYEYWDEIEDIETLLQRSEAEKHDTRSKRKIVPYKLDLAPLSSKHNPMIRIEAEPAAQSTPSDRTPKPFKSEFRIACKPTVLHKSPTLTVDQRTMIAWMTRRTLYIGVFLRLLTILSDLLSPGLTNALLIIVPAKRSSAIPTLGAPHA